MVNQIPVFADHQAIQLRDGRTLGYAEYGCSQGKVLFYFHGHPGARLEARFLASEANLAGARLIGIDRPGMGISSYQPGRRLLDWPGDVSELADQLGIDPFAVVGFSGGGPYALACAYRLPHRLTACGIVAGVGKLSPLLALLSQWLPWLILPQTRRFFRSEKMAEENLLRFAQKWVEPDRNCLALPGIRELMAASLVEGLRQGARGAAYDGALLGRPWGFQLEEVKFPRINLWHGELDDQVSAAAAREAARRLPQCKANFYPGEGHISLIVNHAKEIIEGLVS